MEAKRFYYRQMRFGGKKLKHKRIILRSLRRLARSDKDCEMIKAASLVLSIALLLMIVAACDDYSHNSIVNTPPVNYVNLTMMNTYGGDGYDWGTSLALTADNGFVITGSTTSNGYGPNTVYLSKIGSAGNVLWYTWLGGWGDDNGEAVILTPDSNILVAGVTSSYDIETGQKIDPNSGKMLDDSSFYLIKTNMDGVVIWEKAYGELPHAEWATSVAVSANDYVVAGYQRKSETDQDLYILKVDADGDRLWQKPYGTPNVDRAYDIVHATSGGYILGGYTGLFQPPTYDPYLVKMSEAGDVLWEQILGDTTHSEMIFSICETRDGGIAAAGSSRLLSPAGSADVLFVLKTDASGALMWQNSYSQSSLSQGRCIVEDSQGALLICGQASGQNAIHIAKLGAAGNLMWSDSTGATGYGMSMQPCGPGYAITGSTAYPSQQVLNNVLLLKIEEDLTNIE